MQFWETRRLGRLRVALVNMEYSDAIGRLILPHIEDVGEEHLVGDWFHDPELVKLRSEILNESELGDAALDATAFMKARKAIKKLDKMLERLARQRERILRAIEECRVRLAKPARKSTSRVLNEPEYRDDLGASGATGAN